MKRLLAALGCLTIVPLGRLGAVPEHEMRRSWTWFPFIGLLIGAVLVGVHAAASALFQPLVVGACVLLAWIMLTGALHLDGFGDVCDGLYGGRTPEQRLRIMKDPHVGAMATVGVSMLLLMKWALVSSLARPVVMPALLLAPCLGRHAMALLGTTMPYARDAGTAAAFVRGADLRDLVGATALAGVAAWALAGPKGLGLLGASMLCNLIIRAAFSRLLGGVTGDALGAAGELTEVLVLLGASVAMSS